MKEQPIIDIEATVIPQPTVKADEIKCEPITQKPRPGIPGSFGDSNRFTKTTRYQIADHCWIVV